MAGGMRVDELAQIPLSFPIYAGVLSLVAASAARQLELDLGWQAHRAESTWRWWRRSQPRINAIPMPSIAKPSNFEEDGLQAVSKYTNSVCGKQL
jgi:hypothetical protein